MSARDRDRHLRLSRKGVRLLDEQIAKSLGKSVGNSARFRSGTPHVIPLPKSLVTN